MRFTKYSENPILKANPDHAWESLCVLNPAVWYEDGQFRMLYRAAGHDKTHYIRLGLAVSQDGYHFTRCFDEPVLSPDVDGADGGGIEDPRVIKFGDTFFVTYASRPYPPGQYWIIGHEQAYEQPTQGPSFILKNDTVTHLAMTKDLVHFKKLGRITDSRYDNRDVILFPEKINGRYWMLSRPMEWAGEAYGCRMPSIWIASSEDMMEWSGHQLLMTGEQDWEDKKIGASTPPLKTSAGWLMLYHGVGSKDGSYRVGAVLLDSDNPQRILARTNRYLMEPEYEYETSGYYNGCVFPTGNVVVDGTLYVYYGAADKYCCVATCPLDELLNHLTNDCRIG